MYAWVFNEYTHFGRRRLYVFYQLARLHIQIEALAMLRALQDAHQHCCVCKQNTLQREVTNRRGHA